MIISIKLKKELMTKKYLTIKVKILVEFYKNMKIYYLYDYFQIKKIKMMTLIFDGILLFPGQQINITDIQSYLFDKTNIPMKISIKPFKDFYPKFGESNIDIKSFMKKYKNICYINKKLILHYHAKKENNIIDSISNNCNLKIKNSKE